MNTKLYRISGFNFNGHGDFIIWFYGAGTMTNIRIDNNRFTGQSADTTLLFFGENSTAGYFYGVIDHNTVTNSQSVALAQLIGSDNGSAPAGTRGTARNMYFENNTVTIGTTTNAGLGCVDSWGGQSIVWRFNTTTNCLVTSHGVTHGWGPVNWELYGNRFIMNSGAGSFQDCYRCFHHQGSGEFLAFDNTFTANGKSGSALAMTHYRSAGSGSGAGRCNGTVSVDGNRPGQLGYPCKRQPGRDVSGVLHPMYNWLNRWSDGGIIRMDVENPWGATNPGVDDHVAADRDYYTAVSTAAQTSPSSPFSGATGMGFGTLANRPASCTATPQATDAGRGGVGYWATDRGEWNSSHSGADGQLFRCSSANTWTLHYTPYLYPHPLTAGGGAPQVPAAPANLRIVE